VLGDHAVRTKGFKVVLRRHEYMSSGRVYKVARQHEIGHRHSGSVWFGGLEAKVLKLAMWWNGDWHDPSANATIPIVNPATGATYGSAPAAATADVHAAVDAAERAFRRGDWSMATPKERGNALLRLSNLMEARREEFAHAETRNTGKPYRNLALIDVDVAIDVLRFFAGAARDVHGLTAGEYAKGHTSIFTREPVGVVAQITPWNYPILMAVWKLGPALAAGCTVVLKPAPSTPVTTLMLAELTREAGIPDGVVNVVTGGADVGRALVEHPAVRMVSVTGSTATGRAVMQAAAADLKRVHLELGGKAPILVFDDADIDDATRKIVEGTTTNSGQDCTAATRVYAADGILADVREALVERMQRVPVGDPFDDATIMGPMVSADQRDRVEGYVERARGEGVQIHAGGRRGDGEGFFYLPTVVGGASQRSEIVQEEVFGPVLTIAPFRDEAEAVALANDVKVGLASSVFTADVGRALRVSRRLEFGVVWVNDYTVFASEAPHGGVKQTGFGKDLSVESMHEYQVTKHVAIDHRPPRAGR